MFRASSIVSAARCLLVGSVACCLSQLSAQVFSTTVIDSTSGTAVTHGVAVGGGLVNFTDITWAGRNVDIRITDLGAATCPGGADGDGSPCAAGPARQYDVFVNTNFTYGGFADHKILISVNFRGTICECIVFDPAVGDYTELGCCGSNVFVVEGDNDPLGFGIGNADHLVKVLRGGGGPLPGYAIIAIPAGMAALGWFVLRRGKL